MPPKKDEAVGDAITGFTAKETKMIAAAFVSTTGADKYDYDLFATLTGNTAGSLKKMWPPVKRKAIDAHPSFGAFLGAASATGGSGEEGAVKAKAAPKPKANNSKKRKATSTEPEAAKGAKEADAEAATNGEEKDPKKKAPAKGPNKKTDGADAEGEGEGEKKSVVKRGRKKVKTEEPEEPAADEVKEDEAQEGAQAEI